MMKPHLRRVLLSTVFLSAYDASSSSSVTEVFATKLLASFCDLLLKEDGSLIYFAARSNFRFLIVCLYILYFREKVTKRF